MASSPEVRVSIIALAVAIAGAILAIFSTRAAASAARTAKQSLQLRRHEEARKKPKLHIDYRDSALRVVGQMHLYEFDISVTNTSDSDNSIVDAELLIATEIEGEKLIVAVPVRRQPQDPRVDAAYLSVPCSLTAHHGVSGVLQFEFAKAGIGQKKVSGYTVCITDAFSREETLAVDHLVSRRRVSEEEGA